MYGESCCTFIPNNTAPDGSVTRALNGLRALSNSMAEDSGVDSPVTAWMGKMFGQWKGLIMSLMMSLAVFAAILVTCGCCCIPCLRALMQRLITRAMEGEGPGVMMPLLRVGEGDLLDEGPEELLRVQSGVSL